MAPAPDELAPEDLHRLRAAQGWLELGLPTEARREAESVSEAARFHLATLDVRRAVAASIGDWTAAHHLGELFVRHHPDLDAGWVHRAYAARRMAGGGLHLALHELLPALDRFPNCTIIPYNLACYACQLEDTPRAKAWFAMAEEREARHAKAALGSTRRMAMEDDDLIAIRAWIRDLPPPRRLA